MKLSPAQAALWHTAESAASSALLTLVVGFVQQISTQQINLQTLVTVFGAGFVAALGLIYKSVRTSPALPQAEADTASQVASEANQLARQALARIEQTWPAIRDLQMALSSAPARTPVPFAPVTQLAPQGPLSSTSAPTMIMPARALTEGKAPQPILFTPPPNLTGTTTVPTLHFGDTGQVPVAPRG